MDKKTDKELKARFKDEVKELNAEANFVWKELHKYQTHVFEYGRRVGKAEAEIKGCCKDGKKKDCKCNKH